MHQVQENELDPLKSYNQQAPTGHPQRTQVHAPHNFDVIAVQYTILYYYNISVGGFFLFFFSKFSK